jgi:hypothetical protein
MAETLIAALGRLSREDPRGIGASSPAAQKKRGKKNTGKQARQKCRSQGQQCTTFLLPLCNGDDNCQRQVFTCCPTLETCEFIDFINCLAPPA